MSSCPEVWLLVSEALLFSLALLVQKNKFKTVLLRSMVGYVPIFFFTCFYLKCLNGILSRESFSHALRLIAVGECLEMISMTKYRKIGLITHT